jgi:hypothetical protein
MLLRVGVETAKEIWSRHFLQLDGRDQAQNIIPTLDGKLVIDITRGLDLPSGTV